ncbi:tetratricopeptide repeat protein [Pontibacter sp. G13]|uniref:tetratricopeptide repeat protein n=1 Tax=Pontibacter sp. G13 TaxID=3074898 RepID=UPI00288B77CF|nr:tetratricopeptide repeat protein [Pontibacter sp. G13]WNJ17296.1 tetratricopeptide repeat protein [Pontibacter sp. G13]
MKIQPEYAQHLIDQYLRGFLTEAEQVEFDKASHDPEFQQQLAFTQDLQRALTLTARAELRKEFAQLDAHSDTGKVRKLNPVVWWSAGIAAAIVLLFAWWNLRPTEPTFQQLALAEVAAYPNLVYPVTRGEATSDISPMKQAYIAYEGKRYDRAALLWESLSITSDSADHAFFLANAYLNQQKWEQAIEVYTQLLAGGPFDFEKQSEWYLAIAYGASGNLTESQVLLDKIRKEPGHPYSPKAQELWESVQPSGN